MDCFKSLARVGLDRRSCSRVLVPLHEVRILDF